MSTAHPDRLPARQRVAFVVTSLHGGGAEAVGIAWMRWFVEAGHEVSALMVSDKPVSDLVPEAVAVHRLGRVRGHGGKVRALRRLFRSERYDAVVALQTYPNLLAIAARGRAATSPTLVVTEHNLISLGLPGSS